MTLYDPPGRCCPSIRPWGSGAQGASWQSFCGVDLPPESREVCLTLLDWWVDSEGKRQSRVLWRFSAFRAEYLASEHT
jgi:hypothetical protein